MIYKIIIGVFAFTMFFLGNNHVIAKNNNPDAGSTDQTPQQIRADIANNTQTQDREQTQKQSQATTTATSTQVREQDREQSQDQLQERDQERLQEQDQTPSEVSQQRRSTVAQAVQQMLQIGNHEGPLGQQVREIAQTQTQNQEKLEAGLENIQSRNGFVRFFIGPKYDEIRNMENIMEQNREQIEQLQQIKNQLVNQNDKEVLEQQIQTLEQIHLQIQNAIEESQNKFSLFGWVFRLFTQ